MIRNHADRQNRAANSNADGGDSSPLLGRVQISPTVEFEGPQQGVEPAFLAFAKLSYLAANLHESLERQQKAGAAIGRVFDQAYIDVLADPATADATTDTTTRDGGVA